MSRKARIVVVVLLIACALPAFLLFGPFGGIRVREKVEFLKFDKEQALLMSAPSKEQAEAILRKDPWLIQTKNDDWTNIFHAAAEKKRSDLVELYLRVASDDHITDRFMLNMPIKPENPHAGETALHYAVRAGDAKSVELMLNAGADPELKSAAGQSPIELAESLGANDLAVLMRQLHKP